MPLRHRHNSGRASEATEYRFIPIRSPFNHKLLFKYEPTHNLIEIVNRGQRLIVDLQQYQADSTITIAGVINE